LIKLILFLALAYLCYRLLLRARGPAPPKPLGPKAAPATPPIDRSKVVDAEYREVDGESGAAGEGGIRADGTR